METIKKILILNVAFLIFTSCVNESKYLVSTPECSWNSSEDIIVNPIALKLPDGMGESINSIAVDGIITNLYAAMSFGDVSGAENKAYIKGNLLSNGELCNGNSLFEYKYNSTRIGMYYLNLDVPSQGFVGRVSVTIRSDDYRTKDVNVNEYVIWDGSSSNPDFPIINGDIVGAPKTYNTLTGKIAIDKNNCLFINGQQVCQ